MRKEEGKLCLNIAKNQRFNYADLIKEFFI